jgi:catechol 2,3-dioxygenase-like lactoylglutathione lyase family enzyme
MFDHLSIAVVDFEKAQVFYDAILAALGMKRVLTLSDCVGYGRHEDAYFWIHPLSENSKPVAFLPLDGHIAFTADSNQQVQDFYRHALALGAADNGQPGLREHYQEDYYAAFVIDPDGYRLEAVHRRRTGQGKF